MCISKSAAHPDPITFIVVSDSVEETTKICKSGAQPGHITLIVCLLLTVQLAWCVYFYISKSAAHPDPITFIAFSDSAEETTKICKSGAQPGHITLIVCLLLPVRMALRVYF